MIKNYLKIAWRNITRNKTNSVINIAGLSIGIASVLIIIIFIQHELSYDKFLKNSDRIFQVTLNGNFGGNEFWAGNTPPPVGKALMDNFPEIESYTRVFKTPDVVIRYSDNKTNKFFTEKDIMAVDSNFLEIFDYQLSQGDAATVLQRPNSILFTEAMAKKYFGDEKPVGKLITMDESKTPFVVTGVLKNIPSQSTLQFDFLVPVAAFPVVKRFSWSWVWAQMLNYVKLKDNAKSDPASIAALEVKFPAMVKVEAASAFKRIGQPLDELVKKGGKWDFHLLALTDVHLRSSAIATPWISQVSNIKYIYIFGSIAFFIIILACVNFMNLSTAQSARRAKEIGIRKVVGSVKSQLIKQFLTEAFLHTAIATVLSIVLVVILLKPFNAIADKSIPVSILLAKPLWLFTLLMVIVVSLLAGSYPAFYLTSFNPVDVLKGKNAMKTSLGSLFLRNGLVVFQFTVSTVLIVCTLVVFRQLQFFRTKNLGFDKENTLIITNAQRLGNSEESFRQILSEYPEVKSASISTSIPTGFLFGDMYRTVKEDGKDVSEQDMSLNSFLVDEYFVPTLNIQILKGRNFSKDFSDSASVILNEMAVQQMGWKEPLGKKIVYPGSNSGNQTFEVIGVARDFNTQSLQTAMTPFALFHHSSKSYSMSQSYVIAKMTPGNVQSAIGKMEKTWKKFANAEPLEYNFLDAAFDSQYRSEQRMGAIFSIFTALSFFVACLGLFGLSAFSIEKRTKEIGIRKVLGSSVHAIVSLLSKQFLKMVLLATLISFPIAWYFMNKWLQDFAYRIDIGWWMFVVAGGAALFIALATVSFLAIKAAVANPVKSLRTE